MNKDLLKIFTNILLLASILLDNTLLAEDAREFFKKLMESAHPLPEFNIKETPLIPFSEPMGQSFFINFPTTVDEVGQYQMQNESSIAINPKNPKVIIASAVDYRDTSATWVYFSTDGGSTWRNKKLGRPYPGWRSSNDPSVAFSYDGIGYMVYGGFGNVSDTGLLFGENGVFLARTFDDCKTWEAHIPIIVHRGVQTLDSNFEDKYYITVDNSPNSPFRGNLYVPWKRVVPRDSSTQIVISRSTDKGSTWSVPIPISPRKRGTSEDTTFGQSFPLATVGPNGEVYVVWNDGIEKGIGFAKSTDGGRNFTPPKIIIRYNPFGRAKYITNQGYRHTVKGKVRAEAYPSIVCDYTGGTRNGYLYLCLAADSIPNVYFSRSTDGGETWSSPKVVHSETKNDQFWPWISIDPTNGDLAIMYFDSRNDPENILVECWVSYSNDGGETWIDRPVSDVASDLRLNPFTDNSFAGDYSGCAFYGGKIFPSWVDMRNSVKNIFDSDVYSAYINLNTPNPPQNFLAKTIPAEPSAIQLTWSSPKTKVFGHPINLEKVKYILKRENVLIGVFSSSINSFKDTGLIPYKFYSYSISAFVDSDTSIEVSAGAYAGGAKNLLSPSIVSSKVSNGNTSEICVLLPKLRADSLTPIVNLGKILIFDLDTLLYEVPIAETDTGKVVCVDFKVTKDGFYRIRVKAEDKDRNQSSFSNEIVAFKGRIIDLASQVYFDDFSYQSPRKYLKYNGWGYATNFFSSAPSSITDSPQGNYPTRTELILGLFPCKLPQSGYLILNFDNAAIVHRTDTAIIELVNSKGESFVLAKYNIEDYAPWGDKVLDQNDWKRENIVVSVTEIIEKLGDEFVYPRLRLVSGTIGVDDGWYIDNFEIKQSATFVENENSGNFFKVSPNPTDKYLKINTNLDIQNIKISDLLGNFIQIEPLFKSANELLLDVSNLSKGTYFIFAETHPKKELIVIPFAVSK
ncbi:MAG: hypothetical protein N2560_08105 [Ignavibacteria bacterium]|nr:hypothetical protein [Ignavibacteria bacterium]